MVALEMNNNLLYYWGQLWLNVNICLVLYLPLQISELFHFSLHLAKN